MRDARTCGVIEAPFLQLEVVDQDDVRPVSVWQQEAVLRIEHVARAVSRERN